MDQKTIKYIAKLSNGDIRFAYNLVEFSYYGFNHKVTIDNIKEVNNTPSFFTDKMKMVIMTCSLHFKKHKRK